MSRRKDLRKGYAKDLWYAPKVEFDPGRNPHEDLFSTTIMRQILSAQGRNLSQNRIRKDSAALQADLRSLAYDFIVAAKTSPFRLKASPRHVTESKRIDWLNSHVILPAIVC